MDHKTKMVLNIDEEMEVELTAALGRQRRYRCPKCKALLMQSELVDGKKVYHCWCCGLIGTYGDLIKQAEQIRQRVYENASRVTCSLCGTRGVIGHELRPKTIYGEKYPQGRSLFICYPCMPEK